MWMSVWSPKLAVPMHSVPTMSGTTLAVATKDSTETLTTEWVSEICFHFCVYEIPMSLESIWTECDTEQKSNERDKNKAAGIIIYKLTSILKDAFLYLKVWRGLWNTVLNSSATGFFKALVLPDKKGSMFAYVWRWRWMFFVFASKENTLYLRG